MRRVVIPWCNKAAAIVGRVVIDPALVEAEEIRRLARGLEIPVVEGQTTLQANDLWVGISPSGGWGNLAGECMWARSAEAGIVVSRLTRYARVVTTKWVIKFRNGYMQSPQADDACSVESAQQFETKEEAETLVNRHLWIQILGGTAEEIVPAQ